MSLSRLDSFIGWLCIQRMIKENIKPTPKTLIDKFNLTPDQAEEMSPLLFTRLEEEATK